MSPLFNNLKKVAAICLVCLSHYDHPGNYNDNHIDLERSVKGGKLAFLKEEDPGTGVVGLMIKRKKKMEPEAPQNRINIVNHDVMNVVMEYITPREALTMQLLSKRFYDELVSTRIQKLLTELGKLKNQLVTMLSTPPPPPHLPPNSPLRRGFDQVRLPTLEILEKYWMKANTLGNEGNAAGMVQKPMIDPLQMTYWEGLDPEGRFIQGVMPRRADVADGNDALAAFDTQQPGVYRRTDGKSSYLFTNNQDGKKHGLSLLLSEHSASCHLWKDGKPRALWQFSYDGGFTSSSGGQSLLLAEVINWMRNPADL